MNIYNNWKWTVLISNIFRVAWKIPTLILEFPLEIILETKVGNLQTVSIVIAVTIFAALLLIRAAVGCLADVVIIVSVLVQGPRVFKLALLVGALD